MTAPEMPTYKDLLWPTLELLKNNGGSASIQELSEQVTRLLALPDEVSDILHGDGPQTEIGHRLAWARPNLKWVRCLQQGPRRLDDHSGRPGDAFGRGVAGPRPPGAQASLANLEARARGTTTIVLRWEPPACTGGVPVTGYRSEVHDGTVWVILVDATACPPRTRTAGSSLAASGATGCAR